ncbi:hypothetical protein LA6_001442 [Marinibacterium anthonyi]|nr:hypothetical protein LA6_001442 [Marinibacterium anthonyi]
MKDLHSMADLFTEFEAHLAGLEHPLLTAVHLIQDEIGQCEHTAFGHIVGVVDEAHRLTGELRRLRQAHDQGDCVTLALPRTEANAVCSSTEDLQNLLNSAASVFELLHAGISMGYFASDDYGPLAVMELAERAMRSAAETEGKAASRLASIIRSATTQASEKELLS